MAGDWIKVELTTPDKPEVFAIAEAFDIDPDAVFGKLFRVWAWFDQHTENGNAPTVTKTLINRITSVTGFADAMVNAGWLVQKNEGLEIPNFERHNGETGKKRALTAKRVAKHKNKSNEEGNAKVTQAPLPKEEKRREDINIYITTFPDLNVDAWIMYLDNRKEAKLKKLTPKGEAMQIKKLIAFGDKNKQQAIVEQSISNGWTGLFDLKQGNNYGANTSNSKPSGIQQVEAANRIDAEYAGQTFDHDQSH